MVHFSQSGRATGSPVHTLNGATHMVAPVYVADSQPLPPAPSPKHQVA